MVDVNSNNVRKRAHHAVIVIVTRSRTQIGFFLAIFCLYGMWHVSVVAARCGSADAAFPAFFVVIGTVGCSLRAPFHVQSYKTTQMHSNNNTNNTTTVQ